MCRVLLPESVLDMVVTWSTRDNTKESICEYGIDSIDDNAAISPDGPTLFVDGGAKKAKQYIHRVSSRGEKTAWMIDIVIDYSYRYTGDAAAVAAQQHLPLPLWQPARLVSNLLVPHTLRSPQLVTLHGHLR